MKLRNCKECGKVMTYGGMRKLCQDCTDKREKQYLEVRNFVKSNPNVAIEVVSEATGVEERRIREFIREGLIEPTALDGFPVDCQRCGKPIAKGTYCPICQQDLASNLSRERPGKTPTDKKGSEKRKSLTLHLRKK